MFIKGKKFSILLENYFWNFQLKFDFLKKSNLVTKQILFFFSKMSVDYNDDMDEDMEYLENLEPEQKALLSRFKI